MRQGSGTAVLRRARPGEAAPLSDLALASKRVWGYSEALMALWEDDLRFTEESLAARWVWVAEREGVPAGVVALDPNTEAPEIDALWVAPQHLGQGFGRRLMERALRAAREAGLAPVTVVADPNAAGFYRHLGGCQTGWQASVPEGRRLPVFRFGTV